MLQAGLPVISTTVVAEGVEASPNLFINDNFDDWVNMIATYPNTIK